jgi:tetratricopeptide (TPR) repeat protein
MRIAYLTLSVAIACSLFSIAPALGVNQARDVSSGSLLAAAASPTAVARPDRSRQAITLERRNDWNGLLELGRQWTQAEPRNATAWFVLGRALGALNRYLEAIAAYRRDLDLDPGDVYARNNLGNLYRDSGQLVQAMQTYRDAVRVNPDYLPAWHNLGLTYYRLKGPAGVSQALQRLRLSDLELADAWYKLAIEYSQSHDERIAQEAVEVLRGLSDGRRQRMFEVLLAGE